MRNKNTIYLISCVSVKRHVPSLAKDLYISPWFLKARHYVERTDCPWYILSAEYGLVSPDQTLAPYEKTLNSMPIGERRHWAKKVIVQMDQAIPQIECAVFLAGQRYREFLMSQLQSRGISVEVPMEGLRIGEQLGWLGQES
jgi:hypothetical protein